MPSNKVLGTTRWTPNAAREIYRASTVIDGSVAPTLDDGYLLRLTQSGVTAVNLTIPLPHSDLQRSLQEIAETLDIIAERKDSLLLVRSIADIEQAKATGRVGIILGPQNAAHCEGGIHLFRVFHQLGVRVMQLTYNERNTFGTGAAEQSDDGLTPDGRSAIVEMQRIGIVLDLSHCGSRTTLEALEAAEAPPVITHANSWSLLPSPRNKTDEHLKLLAAHGGVIGLTLWAPMLAFDRRAGLEDFLRHVDYVANLIGVDHIGIGTDHSEGGQRDEWERNFGRGGRYPTITGHLGPWYSFESRFAVDGSRVEDFPKIHDALTTLGFTASELKKVLGENFLRVFGQVWAVDSAMCI